MTLSPISDTGIHVDNITTVTTPITTGTSLTRIIHEAQWLVAWWRLLTWFFVASGTRRRDAEAKPAAVMQHGRPLRLRYLYRRELAGARHRPSPPPVSKQGGGGKDVRRTTNIK